MRVKLIVMLSFATTLLVGQQIDTANFEGIIKYISYSEAYPVSDTTIYYFGKTKVRIKRTGRLVEQYSGLSDQLYDFENPTVINTSINFFVTGAVEYIEAREYLIQSIVAINDTLTSLEERNSKSYLVSYQPTEYMGSTINQQLKFLTIDSLNYKLPESWICNGYYFGILGKIAIEAELVTRTIFTDGTEKVSVRNVKAIEVVQKELPDEIFDLF
ncbi:MAG: hypothetical protein R2795_23945 [Saprospiraceae bacterium]